MRFYIAIFFSGIILSNQALSIDTSINTFNIHNKSNRNFRIVVFNGDLKPSGYKVSELPANKNYSVKVQIPQPTSILLLEKRKPAQNVLQKLGDAIKEIVNTIPKAINLSTIFDKQEYDVVCAATFNKEKTIFIKYKIENGKSAILPQEGIKIFGKAIRITTAGNVMSKNVLPNDINAECAK